METTEKAQSAQSIAFYSKIDYEFLQTLAEVLTVGSQRYDPHLLVENWRLGDINFYHDRVNHCIEHVYKWLSGDRTERHLIHAAANLMMLFYAERKGIYSPGTYDARSQQWVEFVQFSKKMAEEAAKKEKAKEPEQMPLPLEEDSDLLPLPDVKSNEILETSTQGIPIAKPKAKLIDIDELRRQIGLS